MSDVIDMLAGIAPGSALDKARDNRTEARKHAQASYDSLFALKDFGSFTAQERFAVAAFVAALHGKVETKEYYADKLASSGASPELRVAIASEVVDARLVPDRDQCPHRETPTACSSRTIAGSRRCSTA